MALDRVKEEILDKADIVEIVSHYVHLQNKGGRFIGLCPFHKEKTPSFHVHPDRGFFHCFGCGKGGNAIDFLMAMENLTYGEARRHLAQKLGIRIESDGPKRVHEEIDRFQVMDMAAQLFAKWLPANAKASEYVQSRGLTPESIKRFGIGFAPDAWDSLYLALKQRNIPEKVQEELGLTIPRQQGSGYYDRFRNRVMFPIRNTLGRTIAFGGRAMSSDDPAKYLNTNDTPLFNKSKVLYLLDQAKSVLKERGAILVEGYMDAISLHIHGFVQTVASLGTALTKEHLNILKRYTNRFTLLYDGDNAGINAAKKGVETFFELGLPVRTAVLPQGLDPDDFIKAEGAEALQRLLDKAVDGFEFYLNLGLQGRDPASPQGKSEIVEFMLPLVARIPDGFIRKDYIQAIAVRIGSEIAALEASIQQKLQQSIYKTNASQEAAPAAVAKKTPLQCAKESLIRLLAFHQGLITPDGMESAQRPPLFSEDELHKEIPPLLNALFERSSLDALLIVLMKEAKLSGKSGAAQLDALFPENKDLSAFLAIAEAEPLPGKEKDLRKVHDETLKCLRDEAEKRRREEIVRQAGGDPQKVLQAMNEMIFSNRKGNTSESSQPV
ncbi:MAG: DNA primase [Candidatus Omnitrophota bacterium]